MKIDMEISGIDDATYEYNDVQFAPAVGEKVTIVGEKGEVESGVVSERYWYFDADKNEATIFITLQKV